MWRAAESWAGRMRLPKPLCGAVVRTKKSMMVPWMVTRGEVVLGKDGAVEREGPCGPDEVDAQEEGEEGSDDYGDEGEDEVLDADDAVVGGEEDGPEGALAGGDHGCAPSGCWCEVSHWENCSGGRTRRLAFMR